VRYSLCFIGFASPPADPLYVFFFDASIDPSFYLAFILPIPPLSKELRTFKGHNPSYGRSLRLTEFCFTVLVFFLCLFPCSSENQVSHRHKAIFLISDASFHEGLRFTVFSLTSLLPQTKNLSGLSWTVNVPQVSQHGKKAVVFFPPAGECGTIPPLQDYRHQLYIFFVSFSLASLYLASGCLMPDAPRLFNPPCPSEV